MAEHDRSFFSIVFQDGEIAGWTTDKNLDGVVETLLGYSSKLRNDILCIIESNPVEGWSRDVTDDALSGLVLALIDGRVA